MTRICIDCQDIIGRKPPYKDKRHTHTLCTPCKVKRISEFMTEHNDLTSKALQKVKGEVESK